MSVSAPAAHFSPPPFTKFFLVGESEVGEKKEEIEIFVTQRDRKEGKEMEEARGFFGSGVKFADVYS